MQLSWDRAHILPTSPPSGDSPVDTVWPTLEEYLVEVLHVLRSGSAGVEQLRNLRHRMNLYSLVYSACSLDVHTSHVIYNRLTTFLLNDLEASVLHPLLHRCDNCTGQQLCLYFLEQYKAFSAFRPFVISCFGYLDQYYTDKYGCDSIGALCGKMFYLVVYEPLRERLAAGLITLANEERTRLLSSSPKDSHAETDARRTLKAIVEIISEVKAHSLSSPLARPGAQGEWTLERIAEEARGMRTQNGLVKGGPGSFSSVFPARHLDGSEKSDEEKSQWAAEGTLEHIRRLRKSLEYFVSRGCAFGEVSFDLNATLSHPTVVDLSHPVLVVLFADIGLLYVEQSKEFYRDKQSKRFSDHACRGYLDWVEHIFDCEKLLARDLGDPIFNQTLSAELNILLFVEPHRQIILDEEAGFHSLLVAFVGQKTAVVNSDNCSPGYWEQFSHAELAMQLNKFFRAFAMQKDEACGVLLTSEFASKVVLDIAAHFTAYLRKESSVSLVDVIQEIVKVYKDILQHQFDNNTGMYTALSGALHEMMNPEHWRATASYREESSVATTASCWPNILLTHDALNRVSPELANLATLCDEVELPIPHLLATYCDRLCYSSGEEDVVGRLDRVVFLVQFLNNKAGFLDRYRLLLAPRLLPNSGLPVNMEMVHMFSNKLLQKLEPSVVHNLGAMLRDYEERFGALESFEQSDVCSELPVKFRVQVLTATHWPSYRVPPMTPYPSLAHCTNVFTRHYDNLHASRTLRWAHSLGTALLSAVFPGGAKEITATIMQATILLLANDAQRLGRGISGAAIADATGISFPELRVHLELLARHDAFGILRQQSGDASGRPLGPEEELTLNEHFTHTLHTFRLPVARLRPHTATSGEQESGMTTMLSTALLESRRHQVNAVIIRIMKSRSSVRYNKLVEEATQQLARIFVPAPELIKAQVEHLVERGFLRRNEEDPSVFDYIV